MYKDVVNWDSTFRAPSEDFRFPVNRPDDRAIPSGRPSDNCSIRPDAIQTKHHPSGRSAFPSRPSTVSRRSIQLASVRTFQQHFRTPLGTLPVSDSFQVLIKGRSTNRLDDVVSRPDSHLHKARIAIQIHPSGRQTALVRTRVHQRRKLLIRIQPSGRLPIMVRTRAHQLCKLRVEDQSSGSSSPMVRTRETL
jgi:hypothetical protein